MEQQPKSIKALVKCVLSADTFVIWGRPVSGPPVEKVVGLAHVSSPRFGKRQRVNADDSASNEDDPFAFEAKEWLRKRIVGKEVTFVVAYTSQAGRDFVTCHIPGESESLNRQLLHTGWSKLRFSGVKTEEADELQQLQFQAEAAGMGLWTVDPVELKDSQPQIKYTLDTDTRAFLDMYKGQRVRGIVEQVRDGSTFRILLLPSFYVITLMMSGIKAPAVRKDIAGVDDSMEPFGEEAKYFTESRILQREVQVVLEGTSNQNFIGSVLHPAGNIAEGLLTSGLAKIVDWSIAMVTGGPQRLRAAEQAAKSKKLRIWKGYSPKENKLDVDETEFEGIVTRILNADAIAVQSSSSGVERKITFSSYRKPKAKDAQESYYHGQAREYARSKLIGQKVKVSVEYVRPPTEGYDEQQVCATVMVTGINIAEALLNKGLGGVIRHKNDEARSHSYDQLLAAEQKAQNEKKGMYSDAPPPSVRINDLSESAAKARSLLPSLVRLGRMSAVVEYVAAGSRFKMFLPKENYRFSFVLAGIKCPRAPRTAGEKGDPFGQEALAFSSRLCLHRDVSIDVNSVDKSGAFMGSIILSDRTNLSVALLESGLCTVHGFSAESLPYGNLLFAAESRAEASKKNLWSLSQEEVADKDTAVAANEQMQVIVTEVLDGRHLYLQTVSPCLDSLTALMSDLSVQAPSSHAPKVGELVSAKYALDGSWYRAKVRKVLSGIKEAEVFYIDYGNTETVPVSNIRALDSKHTKLAPMAQEAFISFIRVPEITDDYGVECAEQLRSLVDVSKLVAKVDYRIGNVMYVTLTTAQSAKSVTEEMLSGGYAQVETMRRDNIKCDWKHLEELEQTSRTRHRGMFEYGDFSLDKDERRM